MVGKIMTRIFFYTCYLNYFACLERKSFANVYTLSTSFFFYRWKILRGPLACGSIPTLRTISYLHAMSELKKKKKPLCRMQAESGINKPLQRSALSYCISFRYQARLSFLLSEMFRRGFQPSADSCWSLSDVKSADYIPFRRLASTSVR